MICPYCRKENPEESLICYYCSAHLVEEVESSPMEILPADPLPQTQTTLTEPLPQENPTSSPAEMQPQDDLTSSLAELPSQAAQAEPIPVEDQPTSLPDLLSAEPPSEFDPSFAPLEQQDDQPEIPAVKQSGQRSEKQILWLVGCFVLVCLLFSCLTLMWGFYRYSSVLDFLKQPTQTPLPTQTPVPTPTQQVIFSDDFSDPASGWPDFNDSEYIDYYYNDAYRMVEDSDNSTLWAYRDDYQLSDLVVEVDATKNGGPDENNMGVICRRESNSAFYYGLVTSDGYYGIVKKVGEDFFVLGREFLEYSEYIKQGAATNHIRLDCVGDDFTLYVNGYLLDQQNDAGYKLGDVGLIIGTYDTPGTDILYDNFIVSKP